MLATTLRATLLALSPLFLVAVPVSAQVRWTTTLDTALEQARERSTLVLVALHSRGNRGTEAVAQDGHYTDRRIAELAERTVNLRVELQPGAPRGDERKIREDLLELEDDQQLAPVPCHIFVAPDEEPRIVSSASGYLTIGQLEWMWADALTRLGEAQDQAFDWEPTGRTRAPQTFQLGAAVGEGTPFPPTEAEVEAALDALDDGGFGGRRGGGWQQMLDNYRTVLASDDRKAMKFAEASLRSMNRRMADSALQMIGEVSPRAWHAQTEEFLGDSNDRTREAAARTLEALREPRSARALLRALPKEDEARVRGRMLRALAACAPTDRKTIQLIERTFDRDRDSYVLAQAVGAAGELEDLETLQEILGAAVEHRDSQVRLAAVAVIASRRDPRLTPLLDELHAAEESVAEAGKLAREILEAPDARRLGQLLREGLDDRASLRSQMEAMRERMRRRREGGDEDPEGDGSGDGGGEDDPAGGARKGGGRRGGGGN